MKWETDSLRVKDKTIKKCRIRDIVLKKRQESANSLTEAVINDIQDAIDSADRRRIIFRAEGPWFCSGLDRFDLLQEILQNGSCARLLNKLIAMYCSLLRYQERTACIVSGAARGGGVGLAACFDSVIASEDANFEIPSGAYAPLARVLIPLLNARCRRFGLQRPRGWMGKTFTVGEADKCLLVDKFIKGLAPEFEQAAFEELTREGKIDKLKKTDLKRIEDEIDKARRKAINSTVSMAIAVDLVRYLLEKLVRRLGPKGSAPNRPVS